jgi:glycosyltransferase involved in cell wall biosynthesis
VGLAQRGHRVTVVCAGDPVRDARIDDGVHVVPTRYLDVEGHARRVGVELRELHTRDHADAPARTGVAREIAVRLCVPDRYVVWAPGAIAAARRLGGDCDVVMSSGPVSAHLVARAVVGDRPWVVDCNDLWSLNPDRSNGRVRDEVDVRLERRVLRRADRLTTVNEPMRDELERRHRKEVAVLYSGVEPAEFPASGGGLANGRVRLVYAGTLYGSQDLTPLLSALAIGTGAGWLDAERLRVSFFGRLSDRAELEAERFGVGDLVETSEPVARQELLAHMVSADALLMPLYPTNPHALPMKLFEYIGAGRPIVAFGAGEHLAGRLVVEEGLGVVLGDAGELARVLRGLVERTSRLPAADAAARERFGRARSVTKLSALIDGL